MRSNGLLRGLNKDRNPAARYSVDEPAGSYATWNTPVTQGQTMYNSILTK